MGGTQIASGAVGGLTGLTLMGVSHYKTNQLKNPKDDTVSSDDSSEDGTPVELPPSKPPTDGSPEAPVPGQDPSSGDKTLPSGNSPGNPGRQDSKSDPSRTDLTHVHVYGGNGKCECGNRELAVDRRRRLASRPIHRLLREIRRAQA